MIKTLLSLRLRALFAGMTAQGRQKNKRGIGTVILFVVLYLYVAAVALGMMGVMFYALAEPYHSMGLDWLYFAMAALMALGFSVIGSVFTTQSQLYDAKDNALLLSMPIPPRLILLSRVLPLLGLNMVFSCIVILPATVVYAYCIKFSFALIVGQLISLLAVTVLAQAIGCLLGWLLHLLLSKVNKSVASLVYMIAFLVPYFYLTSKANEIMTSMITQGQAIADTLSWIWPIYALGKGSAGELLYSLGSLALCVICFGIAYAVLSATFLKAATSVSAGRKRRKLDLSRSSTATPANAIFSKELRKFLNTPVYLTNMGLGLIMTLALAVTGIWLRKDLQPLVELLGLGEYTVLLVCGIVAYLGCMTAISCPSVSLEGKNLWILKSMPISSKNILLAKLGLHNRLAIPVNALAGLTLSIGYGCSVVEILLCTLFCGLTALLYGLIGMNAGLKWAKLDYISEAYPCKQSIAVMVAMFGSMGVPMALALLYIFVLRDHLSPMVYLISCTAALAAASYGLYKLLTTWGAKKWESLG